MPQSLTRASAYGTHAGVPLDMRASIFSFLLPLSQVLWLSPAQPPPNRYSEGNVGTTSGSSGRDSTGLLPWVTYAATNDLAAAAAAAQVLTRRICIK